MNLWIALEIAGALAVLRARPAWDLRAALEAALDHLEQRLAGLHDVEIVVDVGLDVLDHSRPLDLAQIAVDDDELVGRNGGPEQGIHRLRILAARMAAENYSPGVDHLLCVGH